MTKLKALIVDDELHCRENLKMLVDEFCPEVEVLALAQNAAEARSLLTEHKPDVVFLDVMMPNEDGFGFLKSLDKREFAVVFTTAHNEFALKAIKASAVDYLEKPINIEELQTAVSKLKPTEQTDNLGIQELLQKISTANAQKKIAVPTSDGLTLINTEEIIHLDADESYTTIYLENGKRLVSSKTIKVYEDNLPKSDFYRVHKSHIINVTHHLKEFSRAEGNMAVMSNGKHIPVSRRKVAEFVEHISTF